MKRKRCVNKSFGLPYILVDRNCKIKKINMDDEMHAEKECFDCIEKIVNTLSQEFLRNPDIIKNKKIIMERKVLGETYLIVAYVNSVKEFLVKIHIIDITSYKEFLLRVEKNRQVENKHIHFLNIHELVSSFLHEMNTPLASISVNIETIKYLVNHREIEAPLKKSILECLDRALCGIDACNNNIKNLKNLSLNNNDFEFTEMNVILNKSLTIVSHKLETNNIKVIHDDFKDVFLECNPFQMSEVFVNLINNSIDCLSHCEKEKNIYISSIVNTDLLIINYGDSGDKIPKEIAANLFSESHSTNHIGKFQGNGLGLSIIKNIINRHNGSIVCDQTIKNIKFIIKLPTVLSKGSV